MGPRVLFLQTTSHSHPLGDLILVCLEDLLSALWCAVFLFIVGTLCYINITRPHGRGVTRSIIDS